MPPHAAGLDDAAVARNLHALINQTSPMTSKDTKTSRPDPQTQTVKTESSKDEEEIINDLKDNLAEEQRKVKKMKISNQKLQVKVEKLRDNLLSQEEMLHEMTLAKESVEREYDSFRAWVVGQTALIQEKTREHGKRPLPTAD